MPCYPTGDPAFFACSPNITYLISSGELPTGTHIDSSTGILAGEPIATGYFTFTIAANNSFGASDTPQPITIMVSAPTLTWVAYTPPAASVIEGTQLEAYTFSVSASCGSAESASSYSCCPKCW